MRALSITTLAFAAHALLIPSCVQWNLGKAIRECAETCVGVNPAESYLVGEEKPWIPPVGGAAPGARPIGSLMDGRTCIAREAEYEADSPLVTVDWVLSFGGPPAARAQRVVLTGAYRRVNFSYGKFSGLSTTVGERFEPEGQKMERDTDREAPCHELNARTMGCAEVKRSKWYPLAVVVAAPFDYLIDPALTVVSTPASVLAQLSALGCRQVKLWLSDDYPVKAPTTPEP